MEEEKDVTSEDTLVFRKRLERDIRSSACLVIIAGTHIGEKVSLGQRRITIGRQPDVEIPIADHMVSRKHAEIVPQADDEFIIRDLGSTNGLFINETRVIKAVLKDGDLIRMGGTVFKFVGPGNVEQLYHSIMSDHVRLDSLTGTFNKQVFHEYFQREFHRCKDLHEPLTLILIDLNHFKQINNGMGLPAGDYALRALASVLKRGFRRTDLFCRSGGEEFGVILPHTTLWEGAIVAERIRTQTEKQVFSFGGKDFNLTVSAGVAALADGTPPEANEVIMRADRGLNQAKDSGRNRVCVVQD